MSSSSTSCGKRAHSRQRDFITWSLKKQPDLLDLMRLQHQPGARGRCRPHDTAAGIDKTFSTEVARVMEYAAAYDIYRGDIEYAG